jgi:hypothetical protein
MSRRLLVMLAVVPVASFSVFVSLALASDNERPALISETSSIVVEAHESSSSGFDEPAHSEAKAPGECDEEVVAY